MSILAASVLKNSGAIYSPYVRYKVNSVVSFNDFIYQNATGINTEPAEDSLNWVLLKKPDNLSPKFILVNGNTFLLIKHPNNSAFTLEVNDAIGSGFWGADEFWSNAMYKGGDINTKTNWLVLSSTEEIPLI